MWSGGDQVRCARFQGECPTTPVLGRGSSRPAALTQPGRARRSRTLPPGSRGHPSPAQSEAERVDAGPPAGEGVAERGGCVQKASTA